jgi:hypothetical protein
MSPTSYQTALLHLYIYYNSFFIKSIFTFYYFKVKIELSRIRTYIRNLEGFRPNPLDDELFYY